MEYDADEDRRYYEVEVDQSDDDENSQNSHSRLFLKNTMCVEISFRKMTVENMIKEIRNTPGISLPVYIYGPFFNIFYVITVLYYTVYNIKQGVSLSLKYYSEIVRVKKKILNWFSVVFQ